MPVPLYLCSILPWSLNCHQQPMCYAQSNVNPTNMAASAKHNPTIVANAYNGKCYTKRLEDQWLNLKLCHSFWYEGTVHIQNGIWRDCLKKITKGWLHILPFLLTWSWTWLWTIWALCQQTEPLPELWNKPIQSSFRIESNVFRQVRCILWNLKRCVLEGHWFRKQVVD
jgi:hypothetical protein